jgi:hypothetical protein
MKQNRSLHRALSPHEDDDPVAKLPGAIMADGKVARQQNPEIFKFYILTYVSYLQQ